MPPMLLSRIPWLVLAGILRTIDAYAAIVKVILNGRVLDVSELMANAAH